MFCSEESHSSYSLAKSLIHFRGILIAINIHAHLQVLRSCSQRFICHHTAHRRRFMISNTLNIDSAVTERSLNHKSYNITPIPWSHCDIMSQLKTSSGHNLVNYKASPLPPEQRLSTYVNIPHKHVSPPTIVDTYPEYEVKVEALTYYD